MNEQQRRAAYSRTYSQQCFQCIGAIALVFCGFLVGLSPSLASQTSSPGSMDDTTAPSFASAEVRDWLDKYRLHVFKKDPKFIGKRREKGAEFVIKVGVVFRWRTAVRTRPLRTD